MKKIILIVLVLLTFCPVSFSEELPPKGCGYAITKETNPIYWGYMEAYAAKLKEALEAKKMFRFRGMGAAYDFILTRNGEIKDMKIDVNQNEYFNKKVKEIILSVAPPPFPDGINVDDLLMSVYLGYEHYDEIRLGVGWTYPEDRDIFNITITTKK